MAPPRSTTRRTTRRTTELPHALEHFERLCADLPADRAIVVLDFDGTLAPIAPEPNLATLPPATREVLVELRDRAPLAVISGRGLADVRAKVGLEGVVYAGSHGFEIEGPGLSFLHEVTAKVAPVLDTIAEALSSELSDVEGMRLERKRVSLAVHDRQVSDPRQRARIDAVTAKMAADHGLRRKTGKRIYELGPEVDWHKGRALELIVERLAPDAVPLYVGDDTTDEDALAVLDDAGVGVVVAAEARPTFARWRLRDPEEVRRFLSRLVSYLTVSG
jgi:alpha,alpha-trehalase